MPAISRWATAACGHTVQLTEYYFTATAKDLGMVLGKSEAGAKQTDSTSKRSTKSTVFLASAIVTASHISQ